MKSIILIVGAVLAIGLSGCHTVSGVGQDVSAVGRDISAGARGVQSNL